MKTHIATVYNLCISYYVYYALQVSQKSFIPCNPYFNSLYLLYIHNQLACKAYTTFSHHMYHALHVFHVM